MKLSHQQFPLIMTSVTIAGLGGLLHPWSIHVSLPRGILTWFVAAVGAGLVLGSVPKLTRPQLLKLSTAPAAALPVSYLLFLLVHWLMENVGSSDGTASVMWMDGKYVDPSNPRVLALFALFALLSLVDFITSYIAVALSSAASEPLILAAIKLFDFGAEGVVKVQKLLIALSALVLAIIGLWNVVFT